MLNKQTVDEFAANGFLIKNTMSKPESANGLYDDFYSIYLDDTIVLYLRKNENDTFNTFELLNYPTSFKKVNNNLSLEKVFKILQSLISNNPELNRTYKMKKLYKEKFEVLDNIRFFRKIFKKLKVNNQSEREIEFMKNVVIRLKNEYKTIKIEMNNLMEETVNSK